jgi:hypothetical protein
VRRDVSRFVPETVRAILERHASCAGDGLSDVVDHYNTQFSLRMTDQEKTDLIQYLTSL